MGTPIQNIAAELKKLSPEDRAALKDLFAGDTKTDEPPKQKNPPAEPKAERVYFFRQLMVLGDVEVSKKGEKLEKKATQLPPRVIIVDLRQASKLFWKQRNRYQYLGSSDGKVWRRERVAGKSVAEAQALEFQEQQKEPDMTPPPNREKTFFAGTNPASASRGQEISWSEGLKQNRSE